MNPTPAGNCQDVRAAAPRRALAARYYTDDNILAAAKQRIFLREWQLACHSSQVIAPGDYFTFSLFEQDLFVMRGDDGVVRCFFNVCRHRGHILLEGAGGARDIVCPYHAWSYDRQGKLKAARNLSPQAAGDIRLTEARAEEFCGFIFVCTDAAAPPMDEAYPGVRAAMTEVLSDIASYRYAAGHDAEEQCNWLIAVENYNECYHCKNAHRAFAKGVILPRSYNIQPFGGGRCLRHMAKAARAEQAWVDAHGTDYASFFLWPAASVQIYPGGIVNTYHWRPLSVTRTRVYRGWFSTNGSVSADLQKVIDLDKETTFAEDLELVKNVQRGLSNIGYVPGPLVLNPQEGIDSEHSIAALHDWFLESVQM